jgi:protocatechuate 3,4-dioxygenase beta subunit
MRRAASLAVLLLTFLAGWLAHSLLGSSVDPRPSPGREAPAPRESDFDPDIPRLEGAPGSHPEAVKPTEPTVPEAAVVSHETRATPGSGDATTGTLRIRLREFTGEAVPGISLHLTGGEPDPLSRAATTAVDGTAEFPGLTPGEWHLQSSFPEGITSWNVSVHAGLRTEIVLVHPARGVRVEGTVRDVSSRPVEGVTVTLSTMEGGVYAILKAKTDADGAYRFEGVRPGGWGVSLSGNQAESGFSRSDRLFVPAGDAFRKDFVVGSLLRGRVLDRTTRAPVAGVQIQGQQRGRYLDTVTTDAEGAFRFDGLRPGTFELLLTRGGYGFTMVRDVEVPERGIDVELEMSPAARLRMHITDAEGRPVAGSISFGVSPKSADQGTGLGPGTGLGTGIQADADGNASYDQILPGSYVLSFEAKGIGKAQVDVNLAPGENSLEVRLEAN